MKPGKQEEQPTYLIESLIWIKFNLFILISQI